MSVVLYKDNKFELIINRIDKPDFFSARMCFKTIYNRNNVDKDLIVYLLQAGDAISTI